MAINLQIEAPDFDEIRNESGGTTSDAIKLLWQVLNTELRTRRTSDQEIKNKLEGLAILDTASADEHNVNTYGGLVYWFNTASSFAVTGFRNGEEGRVLFLHNSGSGTITFTNNSGSSAEANRLINNGGANVTMAPDESMIYLYVNARWREWAEAA